MPRLGSNGEALVRIRSVPLGEGRPIGWLLMLQDAGDIGGERPIEFHGMQWTRDPAMKHMFGVLERVAASDATVLVRGETGTGKGSSPRPSTRCRTAPADRCARSTARRCRPPARERAVRSRQGRVHRCGARHAEGHIVLADGGTLFLDEVAELPLELRASCCACSRPHHHPGRRAASRPGRRARGAATQALRKEVEAGRFRADLMPTPAGDPGVPAGAPRASQRRRAVGRALRRRGQPPWQAPHRSHRAGGLATPSTTTGPATSASSAT
ncbi:MAG: sigma 54-interacting transcriptional regulator [Nannocystaceae bacterium]